MCPDLGLRIEMIILESILTLFKSSLVFEAIGAVTKTDLNLKPNKITKYDQSTKLYK